MAVAGARPNFMKVAPIVIELAKRPDLFSCRLIHTGQHSDPYMSNVFFRDLILLSLSISQQICTLEYIGKISPPSLSSLHPRRGPARPARRLSHQGVGGGDTLLPAPMTFLEWLISGKK